MQIKIRFPGNKKVSAEFETQTIVTDQPKEAGGDGSGPAPFDLFLASLGTCAGIFVLSFCQKRGIPTEGLELRQTVDWDEATHLVSRVAIEVVLPKDFPEKYRDSVLKTAELCTVKRHLVTPPRFEISLASPSCDSRR